MVLVRDLYVCAISGDTNIPLGDKICIVDLFLKEYMLIFLGLCIIFFLVHFKFTEFLKS